MYKLVTFLHSILKVSFKKLLTLHLLLIFLLYSNTRIEGKNKPSILPYKGFSGGMFIHAGHLQSRKFHVEELQDNVQISGTAKGLGGRFGFQFGDIRLGCEGFSSSVKYMDGKSLFRTGQGGITLEYIFLSIQKFKFFSGASMGGGSSSNILFLSGGISGNNTIFKEKIFIDFAPVLGIEYPISQKLSFALKADYTFYLNRLQAAAVEGFRLYLGLIFDTHYKKNIND